MQQVKGGGTKVAAGAGCSVGLRVAVPDSSAESWAAGGVQAPPGQVRVVLVL